MQLIVVGIVLCEVEIVIEQCGEYVLMFKFQRVLHPLKTCYPLEFTKRKKLFVYKTELFFINLHYTCEYKT